MNDTNTGGPAFPGPYVNDKGGLEAIWKQGGMTLRDYFAAKASEEDIRANIEGPMQECIVESSDGRKHITHRNVKYTREQAKYRYADTMLKAREA
jgi:hypothetical protein